MKRVCFFSGDITRSGGTERAAAAIANGLVQSGKYQVLILSIIEGHSTPFFDIDSAIKRHVLKKGEKWISPGPGYLPLVPALRRFLKQQKVDVLIDVDLVLDALALTARVRLGVKVVSWEHFHYEYEQKTWYRRLIGKRTARFSDYIVTLTPEDKETYQKRLGRSHGIDFIYNPLEPAFAAKEACKVREKMILTVGRLNEEKGTDLLAQIVPEILCDRKDWKWVFLGDGEYKRLLEESACRYGLQERLVLAGTVSNVEEYLRTAAISVLGSRTEAFGMCLLEAKACQVPAVAFDVPWGPSEMIQDGVNGFLIPPFDIEQMGKKIILLMEQQGLREQFSKKTAVGLEKFQLAPILQKWDQLLSYLCD